MQEVFEVSWQGMKGAWTMLVDAEKTGSSAHLLFIRFLSLVTGSVFREATTSSMAACVVWEMRTWRAQVWHDHTSQVKV